MAEPTVPASASSPAHASPRASADGPRDTETLLNGGVPFEGITLGGRYELVRRVGAGASAWVFAARDLRLEREVAVKVLKPSDTGPGLAQRARERRVLAEGRTLARLVHPHIVAVYDAGETPDGLVYLVMELSDAGNLEDELLVSGPLSLATTLQLILPLIGALACAHDRGIIHRDIKPANIAVARHRDRLRAKLLDFGIAKDAGAATSREAVGTPAYMAPEQARGEAVDAATDVWGVGVLLFRCLTGQLPFNSQTAAATLLKVVSERAPRFRSVLPSLPRHVAAALDRTLDRDPRDRYPDMRELARALAFACRQDGIALPEQPEPLGLPDFSAWLANADTTPTGRTCSASASARATGPLVAPLRARGGVPLPLLVGVGALLACAAIGIGLPGSDSNNQALITDAPSKPRASSAPDHVDAQAVEVTPPATPSAAAIHADAEREASLASSPGATSVPASRDLPSSRRRPSRRAAQEGAQSVDHVHEAQRSVSERAAQQGFMTAWE